jgi:hypothetical protein
VYLVNLTHQLRDEVQYETRSIVLGETHLRRTLTRYFRYYHNFRTHLSLEKDAPTPRAIQNANLGLAIEVPEVGGLHHHYERRVA